jgi:hypothetical protein
MKFRKGNVYILLFSLFLVISGTYKFRAFINKDLNEVTIQHLVIQVTIIFLVYVIPGLLFVRWYYKIKDKS